MPAILFGSISTVADTSELQRDAFNKAFAAHGLNWVWDQDLYRSMLADSGGQSRVAQYAESVGETVDAKAVHQTKSEIFRESLAIAEVTPRAGVVDAIKYAQANSWQIGLVTTTAGENVSALLSALSPAVASQDFDVIVDSSVVEQPKPDKAAYVHALQQISVEPGACVAIEDNVDGVASAVAAGVACVAFPNQNTSEQDFAAAALRVDRLDAGELQQQMATGN